MTGGPWSLYMIRCRHGTLYTGISTDVARRYEEHQNGGKLAARYLRGKGPLELVFQVAAGDRSAATRLERQVKGLSREVKEALISGSISLQELFDTTIMTDSGCKEKHDKSAG